MDKKFVADNMSLAVYNEDGALFFVSRNMSNPDWFMSFSVPTAETNRNIRHLAYAPRQLDDATHRLALGSVDAKWMPPILTRNVGALSCLVKQKLCSGELLDSQELTYIYTQGSLADMRPRFAGLDSCGLPVTPADDERKLAIKKYFQESHHGHVHYADYIFEDNFSEEEDLEEAKTKMIEIQMKNLMDVIRSLVAEA